MGASARQELRPGASEAVAEPPHRAATATEARGVGAWLVADSLLVGWHQPRLLAARPRCGGAQLNPARTPGQARDD